MEETKQDTDELERLINKPKKYKIGEKIVYVEAHPPGAVTCIIRHIIEKAKRVDIDIMKQVLSVKADNKDKKKNAEIDTIYELLSQKIQEDSIEDFKLFQLILTPTKTWTETKGNFELNGFPISTDELEWNATENQLLDIFMEWTKRNPRFDRQKKILSLASR